MDIYAVRRENLQLAVTIASNMTKLADKVDSSLSYLSQCASEKIKKPIGSSLAKRVETALGFDRGWMDTPRNYKEEDSLDSTTTSLNALIEQLTEDEKDDMSEYIYMMIRKRKLIDKYK